MSNQDGHRADYRRSSMLKAGLSRDAVDGRLLRTLNERGLELIVRLARSNQETAPPAVSANRALWCDLHTAARQRAANSRLLLLDLNFADSAWWRNAAQNRSVSPTACAPSYLAPHVTSELMRETLTFAWMVARADPCQATIFCGMTPHVANLFCAFSPSHLERHSYQHHGHLRLRFDDQPSYWRMHLKAAGRAPALDAPVLEEDRQQGLL